MLLAVEWTYEWAVLLLNSMAAFLQETLVDDVQVKTARGRDEPDKNRGGAKVHAQESLHGCP